MDDPISTRSNHVQTLREKFELEKHRISYTDFHYKDVKTRLNMAAASPFNPTPKAGNKDEIIKHMSNLPSYLETRKDTQEKTFNFGVMDWGKLQKWQYQHQHLNKCSPSSSHSSPLFTTEGSTPQSTIGQRCSFSSQIPQRSQRVTLQSHFNTTSCLKSVKKLQDFYPPNVQETESNTKLASLKGKMKTHDPFHKTQIENNEKDEKIEKKRQSFYSKISDLDNGNSEKDEKRQSFYSKIPNLEKGIKVIKPRNMSPLRRFSFSNTKVTESPRKSGHASPLRRLFEPLFQLKPPKDNLFIPRLDLINETCESTSTRQAMFQLTVKNGKPLFTFAIENNDNILAATVRDLSGGKESGKEYNNHWMYTFFAVNEIRKKNAGWLSGKKDGYAPTVTAQMTVTNRSIYNSDTREFSLFRVDPYDEVAAVVVKFSRNFENEVENKDRFNATVILPGGNHGVGSNGKPSPLTDRWRSGGVCDCGGWDLGCRLRILTNKVQDSGRVNSTKGQFELFFQGDGMNKNHFFSFCPVKDGMFSVEYNSSVSPLQAFSICISILECRKSSQQQEATAYVTKQVTNDPNPLRFASFPPLSPVGRV